jgi:ribonucleoside-diphosphate reductase alpha chain
MHSGESWEECAERVARAVAITEQQHKDFVEIIRERIFIPGGRYLYSAGRPKFMNSNCYGFDVEDSREAWAKLLHDVTMCLSTGGGLGVNYSQTRPSGSAINTLGGTASGPLALMQMVNEVARHVMAGGKRRSALWAGLDWRHGDIDAFLEAKDWNEDVRDMKAKHFEYPAPLDMTNISVLIDDDYLRLLQAGHAGTWALHYKIVEYMARTGEPGLINMSRTLQDDPTAITRNACCESTLSDRDTCNLGSIVMPRIRDLKHLEEVTRLAIQFLYNGSVKAQYPTDEIAGVAARNRRLGLGIMGLHEWMLMRGRRYEWDGAAEEWFETWRDVSDHEGATYARQMNGAKPITTRAIAPTGTISIIAETTSGIEPIYCVAYQRRYINGGQHVYQYVIDPTAKRLMEAGAKPEQIEDAYGLSRDIERRLRVQAKVQDFTDQAISNTINLPQWNTEGNQNPGELAEILAAYLPKIKGLTVYPNNSRSGQPLNPVPIEEARYRAGVVFEEESERCANGVCGL